MTADASTRALRGGVAGAVGTAALELAEPIERLVAGGPTPFRPSVIAEALYGLAGRRAGARGRARFGRLLRWSYGPGWGVLYSLFRARLPGHRTARAAALAGTIVAIELVALPPLVGRRFLAPRNLAALGVHVVLFAACVELALGRGDGR